MVIPVMYHELPSVRKIGGQGYEVGFGRAEIAKNRVAKSLPRLPTPANEKGESSTIGCVVKVPVSSTKSFTGRLAAGGA